MRTAYGILGTGLVLYVALCTPNRDSVWGADAWEHHRAIVAMVQEPWQPGNPTYATSEPSIRYSPYTVALASICRVTGWDPYSVLSGAAVFNTVLLVIGIHVLLSQYRLSEAGPCVLIVMVGLYGTVPGYANSYALADLPWHQVNPSALSFPLAIFMWAMLKAGANRERTPASVAGLGLLGALSMLTHAYTGVFAFIGMGAMALAAPAALRRRLMRRTSVAAALTFALCLAWPWFSFWAAVVNNQDREYWFNPVVTRAMLTEWTLPALLCVPILLGLRRNHLVRFCLIGAAICYGLAMLSFVTRSPILARVPMPAILLLHIPIGYFVWKHRLLDPRSWRDISRDLLSLEPATAAPACIKTLLIAALALCLLPQIVGILHSPALARRYVAPLLGKQDKQLRLKSTFEQLLEPVGPRDVVLSDLETSWPVPSFGGRMVAALHYETFTPDQPRREQDLETFFATDDLGTREQILRAYGVKWIVLNESLLSPRDLHGLLEPSAVRNRVDYLVLMDAERWLQSQRDRMAHPQQMAKAVEATLRSRD